MAANDGQKLEHHDMPLQNSWIRHCESLAYLEEGG